MRYNAHIDNQPTKKELKMTYQELMQRESEGVLSFSHDAFTAGYISITSAHTETYPVYSYRGRFGSGFVVHKPSFKSTKYHVIEYYIYN